MKSYYLTLYNMSFQVVEDIIVQRKSQLLNEQT